MFISRAYFPVLFVQQNRPNDNPTVINARLNEASTSRATMYAMFIINAPQVLAIIIVLGMHWSDPDVCDTGHTNRWKLWALFSGVSCRVC